MLELIPGTDWNWSSDVREFVMHATSYRIDVFSWIGFTRVAKSVAVISRR
uniref:Uncharacterized protein n=1 Tax=Arundo donax TaxID=35708 RepID=A0A0A9AIZ9_ARUDO